MTRLVLLQMMSLLIFIYHLHLHPAAAAAAGSSSRCVSVEQVNRNHLRFQRIYWDRLSSLWAKDTLNNRSLSPWKYSQKREDNRFPYEILFAECLYRGCIINQHEDMRYNSVPVFASLMVLRRMLCPQDPNKYVVRKDFIRVPVACVCAWPKYAK